MGRRIIIDVDTKTFDADHSVTAEDFLDAGMRMIAGAICHTAKQSPDPRAYAEQAGILFVGELGDTISCTLDDLRRNT